MNRLPLDNATLKLQHHSVGRCLAHRKDKHCVCGMRDQGQQSVLVMRRFLAKGYCIRAKVRPLQVDAAARWCVLSHNHRKQLT